MGLLFFGAIFFTESYTKTLSDKKETGLVQVDNGSGPEKKEKADFKTMGGDKDIKQTSDATMVDPVSNWRSAIEYSNPRVKEIYEEMVFTDETVKLQEYIKEGKDLNIFIKLPRIGGSKKIITTLLGAAIDLDKLGVVQLLLANGAKKTAKYVIQAHSHYNRQPEPDIETVMTIEELAKDRLENEKNRGKKEGFYFDLDKELKKY